MRSSKFLTPAVFFVFSISSVQAFSSAGVISHLEGEVFVNEKAAALGQNLEPKNKVSTKRGSTSVLLGNGTVVHLGSHSQITIQRYAQDDKLEDMALEMKFGRLRAVVATKKKSEPKNFTVKTRTATMGVRGTHVLIDSPEEGPESFLTVEGTAQVVFDSAAAGAAPTSISLKENETIRSDQRKVESISPSETRERVNTIVPARALSPQSPLNQGQPQRPPISYEVPPSMMNPGSEGQYLQRDPQLDPIHNVPVDVEFKP